MPEESLVARLRAYCSGPDAICGCEILREAADALERTRDEARSEALDAVASYIMTYGGMSGGPESWADLADAIREDRFGPTDEQARIMHQVLTGGTF